jgi:hypothetical protein
VTDEEVAAFGEQGWVHLPGLLGPGLAAALLDRAQGLLAGRPTAPATSEGFAQVGRMWEEFSQPSEADDLMFALSRSGDLGRAAQRLMARDVGVRLSSNAILCKLPEAARGIATVWHQDWWAQPMDRVGRLAVWVALNEIPPERGSMRFLTGAHREGPLGRIPEGLLDHYPQLLDRYEPSPPLHLRPGDATVHHCLVPHWAPANITTEPRWALVLSYFPADSLYTGGPWYRAEGLDLRLHEPFAFDRFPLVCPGPPAGGAAAPRDASTGQP